MLNRDEIIRMAQEARCDIAWANSLERFAALVAKHEREACAGLCDEIEKRKWQTVMHGGEMQGIGARDCAAAIRDRGEK